MNQYVGDDPEVIGELSLPLDVADYVQGAGCHVGAQPNMVDGSATTVLERGSGERHVRRNRPLEQGGTVSSFIGSPVAGLGDLLVDIAHYHKPLRGCARENPDEDLPADFDARRDEFYKTLELPLGADRFIAQLREEVRDALHVLDSGLEKDNQVRIGAKGGGWITLTPLDAQPDPPTLTAFKADLNATWPMTRADFCFVSGGV